MIDRIRFKENFIYLDKEVVAEIIDIFLDEYQERLNTIQKNIADQDFAGLKFSSHSLKGVVSNFMDPVAIDLTRKLDEQAKQEMTHGLNELFENLKKGIVSLAGELREIKKEFI